MPLHGPLRTTNHHPRMHPSKPLRSTSQRLPVQRPPFLPSSTLPRKTQKWSAKRRVKVFLCQQMTRRVHAFLVMTRFGRPFGRPYSRHLIIVTRRALTSLSNISRYARFTEGPTDHTYSTTALRLQVTSSGLIRWRTRNFHGTH